MLGILLMLIYLRHLNEWKNKSVLTFTFIHLSNAFIQSDLQLLYMSEVACHWSN